MRLFGRFLEMLDVNDPGPLGVAGVCEQRGKAVVGEYARVARPLRCVSLRRAATSPVMRLSRLGVAMLPAAAAFFAWPASASRQGSVHQLTWHVTSADTAAILRAAVDSGWHLSGVLQFRVVDGGDAAEVMIEQVPPHRLGDSALVARFGYVNQSVRVVRRMGTWVKR